VKNLYILFVTVLFLTGCSNSTSNEGNNIDVLIAEVRNATQSYRTFDNATEAGWNTPLSPCVEHPQAGGMGYHYGKMEFFDGRTNHLEPQVLLYEPRENGSLQFVGVEYIVPFEVLSEDSEAPVLFEQPYNKNLELGFWALHVWTEKVNPSGMFADFNPYVSCAFAND
jgi:hypothetical protein